MDAPTTLPPPPSLVSRPTGSKLQLVVNRLGYDARCATWGLASPRLAPPLPASLGTLHLPLPPTHVVCSRQQCIDPHVLHPPHPLLM